MPVNREEDRGIAQHTKIEGVMGVLPDVLATDDDPLG